MSEPAPPILAGLSWDSIHLHLGYCEATATKEWWPIYRIAGPRLAKLGITLRKDERYGRWIVRFTLCNAPSDAQRRVAELLREINDELWAASK